jgi:NTP pyrophosphatase (non-canonical NTP hydrolase)
MTDLDRLALCVCQDCGEEFYTPSDGTEIAFDGVTHHGEDAHVNEKWDYDIIERDHADADIPVPWGRGDDTGGGTEEAPVADEKDGVSPVRDHYLLMGHRWGNEAEDNIREYGNQRVDTLLFALMEEVGEIALAVEQQADPGSPSLGGYNEQAHEARELISEIASLGIDVRAFLEKHYESPAGSDYNVGEVEAISGIEHTEPVVEEIEDAAPLLFQLYWAVNGLDKR